jgi:hypothetical protein
MCEAAKTLITGYLDALEEYDRLQLIFLAAYRRNDEETVEAHRSLLLEAKFKLQAARKRFKDHQVFHNCAQAINFGNDFIQ